MLTARGLGELGIIERLRRRMPRGHGVVVGIGDDAAVLALPAARARGRTQAPLLLFASDMIVEGVHFDRRRVPPLWIGWKALACNVSDIAAMGGRPWAAVVSLGAPRSTPAGTLDGIAAGLARCARRFGMGIVGGDTVRAPRLVVDVAILGLARPDRVVLRSGARPGDAVFVTGRLGGSYPSGRHARFMPRVAEAQRLLNRVRVHAMMDLSDGLASDLWQLSRASRVRLRVEAARIPIAPEARTLQHALMDGEDYELLFTVGWRDAARVLARLGRTPVTRVGSVIRRGIGVELEEAGGRVRRLSPQGFKHFS